MRLLFEPGEKAVVEAGLAIALLGITARSRWTASTEKLARLHATADPSPQEAKTVDAIVES